MTLPLSTLSVVVTRTREQSSSLATKLRDLGAMPVEVPLITIAPPADRGSALRAALAELSRYDWLVVTSTNGVDAVVDIVGPVLASVRVAAIGPATAARLRRAGVEPALVPERYVAEGLLGAFPAPPVDRVGRVLLAQAADARHVLAEGLRERGWSVDPVVAYQTVAADIDAEARWKVAGADAVTFTSSSTIERFVDAFGVAAVPPIVACIGPITASSAREHGLDVTVVADPHTIDGLVDALVAHVLSMEAAD